MLNPLSIPDRGTSAEKLQRSIYRTQLLIAFAYSYDVCILFGFYAAGYVGLHVPVLVGLMLALLVAAVNCAHARGWTRKLKDPTLFLPQQLYAIAVALSAAVMAPAIGFQPLVTLIAISAFSFMAPDQRSLVWSWIATAIGTAVVIMLLGPQLAIPSDTPVGRALSCAVMLGVLARCIWVAVFVRKLQMRLRERNKALQVALGRIEIMANRDELSGLPNRRAIIGMLADQMALADRADLALSVAILDLDHFKEINDAHGHLAGDRALQIFSELALDAIRGTDRLGRYGGEEFLLVMPATSLAEAEGPLNRIRERMAAWDWSSIGESLQLTLTIGATQYTGGDRIEDLVRRADLALYHGKLTGRDRIVLDRGTLPRDEQVRLRASG